MDRIIKAALDLVESRFRSGTATTNELVHLLKIGRPDV